MEAEISIITPCYNGEAYISFAIESVLRQADERIEMIVCDDGSSDRTVSVIQSYDHPSLKLIQNSHVGAGKARNLAIDKAQGDWIIFLDCDDSYLPGSMEKLLSLVHSKPGNDADIIQTPKLVTDINVTAEPAITMPQTPDQIEHHLPMLEFWTCIYRKRFLDENKIRFFEYQAQDIESAFRYRAYSRTDKILTLTDFFFYLQRNNPCSNVHTWNHRVLHWVKANVYYVLFQETAKTEDKPYLMETVLDQMSQLAEILKIEGSDKDEKKEVLSLISSIKQSVKGTYSAEEKKAKVQFCKDMKVTVKHSGEKVQKALASADTQPPDPNLEIDDLQVLCERLKNISENFGY